MHTLDRNHLQSVITLEMQSSFVARGLVKVSRGVLFASIATSRAGVLLAIACDERLGVFTGLTDSLFGRIVDAGRTTGGRKVLVLVLVFVFAFDGMQMMGGECIE